MFLSGFARKKREWFPFFVFIIFVILAKHTKLLSFIILSDDEGEDGEP